MKKDIAFHKGSGVYIAIANDTDDEGNQLWAVFLINRNDFPIENLMVVSRGYGEIENERKSTSVLRHMFPRVEAHQYITIEPIDPSVFSLTNEFFITYYVGTTIYDKKFLFVPDTIVESNYTRIPLLDKIGILH